jgi:DNA-binding HxlR family transcriptional regulator
LAISAGAEDDSQMRLLSILEELNSDEKSPSFDELLEHTHTVKTHLEQSISELSDKDYIRKVSESWRNMYHKTGYNITEKGKQALELHVNKVKHFISLVMETYRNNKKEELYKLVTDNRDFLWFGYYKQLITKQEIENIAKMLDVSVASLWWHDGRDHTHEMPFWPGLLFG